MSEHDDNDELLIEEDLRGSMCFLISLNVLGKSPSWTMMKMFIAPQNSLCLDVKDFKPTVWNLFILTPKLKHINALPLNRILRLCCSMS